ncbi:carbohydrate kinase family protein [Rhodovulum sp. YNF3179]|uniref:carbohydrate kinase family protein n=1 Tax=Rhodovulum sp. YNF3179 TaxID=3425127 RepID=UPI003D32640F
MILCCGEALIDMLPRETDAGAPCFAPHAGGAVFNTAVALGRLGAPAGFFSGLSTDFFGDQLRGVLAESGVDTALAVVRDAPTTLAFVRLVDGQARYAFYDENTAGRRLSPGDLPALPDATEALFFGGISLIGEPCGSAYETLMLREAGRRVTMIDPNIRPGFVSDETAYRARIDRMVAAADIVKLSDEDLGWLEGAGDPADVAPRLLARGPSLVVVTLGAAGALAVTADGPVSVRGRPAEVADTVGAGDTFNAGLLAGLAEAGAFSGGRLGALDPATLSHALDLGAAAAAVTVSRAGANPPWRRDLDI